MKTESVMSIKWRKRAGGLLGFMLALFCMNIDVATAGGLSAVRDLHTPYNIGRCALVLLFVGALFWAGFFSRFGQKLRTPMGGDRVVAKNALIWAIIGALLGLLSNTHPFVF